MGIQFLRACLSDSLKMIKIKLLENDTLRKDLEKIHWDWFSERAKTTCSWDKSLTYKDFIKNNIIYATATELNGLTNSQKDDLFDRRLQELIVGPDDIKQKGLNFFYRWIILNGKMQKYPKQKGVALLQDQEDYNKKIDHLKIAFGYDDFCTPKESRGWYKEFKQKYKCDWSAEIFCDKLNIDVCPYCNREYTFLAELFNGLRKRLSEIDHFFPQSIYPYFSCYLYNFIPSCLLCNHGKKEKVKGIVYPYENEFGNRAKFNVKLKNGGTISLPCDTNDVQVQLKLKGSRFVRRKIQKSDKMFCISAIYNEHKTEINDLLRRYYHYGANKSKDLYRLFNFGGIVQNGEIPKYFRDILLGIPLDVGEKQYPLRKFKEDVIEQFDETYKEMKK